ncbi:MAG: DUF1127 domain-containing protein [Proteobacteria bacterium]|nr:DUF1127 domain-containing protein [Pseudomonadota bacterium]
MATLNTTTAPFGAITTYRVIHAIEGIKNNLVAWNTKRSTYIQLSALGARELDDIGLTRADVEDLNTGFFRY